MTTRRVAVVVTAHASYARIKSALAAIAAHPDLDLRLIAAGSALLGRYGDTTDHIERDGFEIAARAYMVVEGENTVTSAKSVGLGLIELATIFDQLKPQAVVTVADRYETLATAAAASYMNLSVVHVQGGEITGSIDEKVRHAVTKLANLHFVSTTRAGERVIQMGEDPATVHVTGCPSIDLATAIAAEAHERFDPFEQYGGVGQRIDVSQPFIVVLQHPVTTEYKEAQRQVEQTLQAVDTLGIPAFWFWPNVDAGSDGTSKGIRVFREHHPHSRIHFFRRMTPEDFLRLLVRSECLVGNSSVGIRECAFLGIPVVNIGTRQAGRERAQNVADVGPDHREIRGAIERQVAVHRHAPSHLYGDGGAGGRIADLIARSELRVQKRSVFKS